MLLVMVEEKVLLPTSKCWPHLKAALCPLQAWVAVGAAPKSDLWNPHGQHNVGTHCRLCSCPGTSKEAQDMIGVRGQRKRHGRGKGEGRTQREGTMLACCACDQECTSNTGRHDSSLPGSNPCCAGSPRCQVQSSIVGIGI